MNINMTIIWLAVLIVLLIVEIQTMALTTIWFAAGALVAIIAAELNAPVVLQIIVFLAVALVILFLLRPKVVKYFNKQREKTNADSLVGKKVKIIETVNNKENTGKAIINGLEWTARAKQDDDIYEIDEWVNVVEISGVKLILTKIKEEN